MIHYGRLGALGHNAAARVGLEIKLVSVNVTHLEDVQVEQMRVLNQLIAFNKAVQVPLSYQACYECLYSNKFKFNFK